MTKEKGSQKPEARSQNEEGCTSPLWFGFLFWLLASGFWLLFFCSVIPLTVAHAHDIPNDITVQTFLKPDGPRLHFLVRVPLKAMRDVEFPKRGPGYLDLPRVDEYLRDAAVQWIANFTEIDEGDARLPKPTIADARVSLESDRSFASYEAAVAHVTGPRLPDNIDLYWDQAMLDVLFDYPIQSDRSNFSIHPGFERLGLRVVTVLRFMPPGGVVRGFEFAGDPGLVRLDPRWHQAALRFVEMGFFHILDGIDHLLFLFCLVIPFRRFRPLVAIVTSFTIAHSITLIASAFNLGVELGQLLILILFIPALEILFRFAVAERIGTIILSAIVAHTAWHWMTDRFDRLRQFQFAWPALTATLMLSVVRWLMGAVIIAGLLWLVWPRIAAMIRREGTQEAQEAQER